MQFTYPAVFYYDEEYEDYAVEFSDICIYAEGDTMEEAYKNAQNFLLAYLETCEDLKIAPNAPNTYESTIKDHPNGQVMLVTVDYISKKKKQKEQEMANVNKFATLQDEIVEDIETNLEYGDNPSVRQYMETQVKNQVKNNNDDDDGGDDDFGLPEIN